MESLLTIVRYPQTDSWLEGNLERKISEMLIDIHTTLTYTGGRYTTDEFMEGYRKAEEDKKYFICHMLNLIYNNEYEWWCPSYIKDMDNYRRRIVEMKKGFLIHICNTLYLCDYKLIDALYDALLTTWEYEQYERDGIRVERV